MKKTTITLALLMIFVSIFAQSPEKMSYQAVLRDSSNQLVIDQNVGMQVSILQGSDNGTAVYVETQNPLTNENGLVSVEIGSGEVQSGDFEEINWANGPYFLKIETDLDGGHDYSITAVSQLLSVPYSLHAKTAGTVNLETDPVFTAWDKDYDDLTNQPVSISDFSLDANAQNITNLADPVNPQDAATKAYVDDLIESILIETGTHPDKFKDSRDGAIYNIVTIGNQVWMAENLRYLPEVTGPATGSETTPYYYVYGYNGTNVDEAKETENYHIYGALYNWPAAMAGSESSTENPSGVQGICPTGWHLPSDNEWIQLTDYLGGESVAGGKLKETGTAHWYEPNEGATNETGFTARPGGSRFFGGMFSNMGFFGYWWCASELNSSSAMLRGMMSAHESVTSGDFSKELGFSVRCVKN